MEPVVRLAGRFVSVCGTIMDALRAPGEPSLACLVVDETNAAPIGRNAPYSGRGFGVAREETAATAMGEAFERYSLLGLDDELTGRASVAELTRQAVPHLSPARLLGLADGGRQGAFAPIPTLEQPMLWVESSHLVTGVRTLVPARYCMMIDETESGRAANEGHWYRATSNGAATATTPERACLGGTFELLERDAFMLMWYHRLRFPFLTVAPPSRLGRRVAAAVGSARLELRLIDLSEVHDVPVVIGAVRGDVGGDTQIGIGGGADTTLAEAAWKAAKEAIAFYAWQRKQIARGTVRAVNTHEEVRDFMEHAMYYMDRDNQRQLDFLFDDPPTRRPPVPERADLTGPYATVLSRLVRHLHGRGIDLYAVDLTPRGAAALGLCTYKVLSPDLIPLDCDHESRHLSQERLRTEPLRRGWRLDDQGIEGLNHVPHPFP